MSTQQAVFRCDGGPGIGGGHVVRCGAIAAALTADGWRCAIAASTGTFATMPGLADMFADCLSLDGGPVDEIRAIERQFGRVDLLVVDHYGRDVDFERDAAGLATCVLTIDDVDVQRHHCHMLLDPRPQRVAAPDDDCRVLAGPGFVPLRGSFVAERPAALARRANAQDVSRVLISCGAVDLPNLTARVLDTVAESLPGAAIDVALGRAATHREDVAARIAAIGPRAALHVDTPHMATLMAQADLAIGAAGTTSWERACLGLPTVAVITADNQHGVAAAIDAAGAAHVLGWYADVDTPALKAAVTALADEPARRQAMARSAATLCDGHGAARIAVACASPLAADGAPVFLRRAAPQDADLMFRWQSAPGMRRHFGDPSVPSWDEHVAWLADRLSDGRTILNVIVHDRSDAGVLRCDAIDDGVEVSILVAPELHGRGVGAAALAAARRLLPRVELHARVHPDNAASVALFTKAGYRQRGGRFVAPATLPHAS